MSQDLDKELHKYGVIVYSVDDKGHVKQVDITPSDSGDSSTQHNAHSSVRRRHSTIHPPVRRRSTVDRLISMMSPDKKQPPRGIVVNCNDVECIFEFKVYEYRGRHAGGASQPQGLQPILDQQPAAGDSSPYHSQGGMEDSILPSPAHGGNQDNADNSGLSMAQSSNSLCDVPNNELQPISNDSNNMISNELIRHQMN